MESFEIKRSSTCAMLSVLIKYSNTWKTAACSMLHDVIVKMIKSYIISVFTKWLAESKPKAHNPHKRNVNDP